MGENALAMIDIVANEAKKIINIVKNPEKATTDNKSDKGNKDKK